MSGFTLLEVMVSISLLGIMLVLVSSSLLTTNRTIQSTEHYVEKLNEVRSAQRFLRHALQDTRAIFLPEGRVPQRLFEGDAQKIRFIAPVPLGVGGALKIHQVESFTSDAGELQLRVTFFEPNGERSWGNPQILMGKLHRIEFSYRGLDEKHLSTGWLAKWPWPERLPKFIRIEIAVDGPVHWPLMIVAVRSNQELGAAL
ncbi:MULTISPECIES: prepilin-type N-terminal cleavage/methylation domain-containing protein [Pseudomonas]|uniref:prepilin-type N-terminal cleavage/methylation domain-containing protein n=1 Tax=Pseudomonas TaxID=286 RepID=UPI0009F931A5|nr:MULTISPECIES: prepilin-type N-terminal cleavage/methylation domain-containing protein [Pseudomonas]NHN68213.1 prepilin-type N-terminal cleavage/methylation domain-containing protein [Pseudomonas fluorescens]